MKIKPTPYHGGVLVELGPNEAQLPSEPAPSLFRIKRVLVPTDFSDCSKRALLYAVAFAKQFGAEIILTYVAEPYIPAPEMMPVETDLLLSRIRQDGQAGLTQLRESIKEGVKVTSSLRIGHPATEIVAAADELDADLIVLSTHGRTGFGRVLLGSVAEHVTRHAHCPVLTVREREREFVKTSDPDPESHAA
jgi:universal stress protein A